METQTRDVGVIEEKIMQISQLFATELHLLQVLKKTMAKIDHYDLEPQELIVLWNKHVNTLELLEAATSKRRTSQLLLCEYVEMMGYSVDYDFWCVFKHMCGAQMGAFESFQALTNEDVKYNEFIQDFMDTAALFSQSVSLMFGLEVTDCAACLSDMLRAKPDDEEMNANGEKT